MADRYKFATALDRLMSYVDVRGESECWLWTASVFSLNGYPRFWMNGRSVGAHRASWELSNGAEIPKGMFVCHSCDNPLCVNPAHLWVGTHKQNMLDMVGKGRSYTGGPKSPASGERCARSKLTEAQVKEIRREYELGATQAALSVKFNTTHANVHFIVTRKTWVDV